MKPFPTTSPLTAFLYELMRDHVVAGDIEGLVRSVEKPSAASTGEDESGTWVLSNGHLAAYAEELGARLTGDLRSLIRQWQQTVDQERRGRRELENRLKGLERTLATERESLAAWLRSRIAQQEQARDVPYISAETKANLEVEIGLARRHLEIVLEGKHRPDSALLGEWR